MAVPSNTVAVSAVSICEITIKRHVGKLRFEGSPADQVRDAGFEPLSITADQTEGLTLVSRDEAFNLYDVRVLGC